MSTCGCTTSLDAGAAGKFTFNLSDTYTKDFLTRSPSGRRRPSTAPDIGVLLAERRCRISVKCSRSTGRLPVPGLDLTVKWRLIGPSKVDSESQNPQLAGPFYLSTAQIPGYNYIDLSANYPLNSMRRRPSWRQQHR